MERPCHGYDIERTIAERNMREWTDVGFSSIYYLLGKLEAAGLVASSQQPRGGQGPRPPGVHRHRQRRRRAAPGGPGGHRRPETGEVLLADREPIPHPVAWDTLERARGSRFAPLPPHHRWYSFDFGSAHPPTVDDVREAIGEACRGMLEPPIANLGVRGIRTATAAMDDIADLEQQFWTDLSAVVTA